MTKLNSSFMIGNVEIPHRTVLAPMAGVTNSAFRTIAKEFGAGLVVMEMISEKGLLYNNEKTLHMLHIDENEHPMSIQLFGGDAEGLKRAADFIQTNTKADIVDINMGTNMLDTIGGLHTDGLIDAILNFLLGEEGLILFPALDAFKQSAAHVPAGTAGRWTWDSMTGGSASLPPQSTTSSPGRAVRFAAIFSNLPSVTRISMASVAFSMNRFLKSMGFTPP